MSYLINNQQKINEIIFAKRNKSYGAYVIRSSYGATILKSLSIMLFGFGSIVLTAYYFSHKNDMDPQKGEVFQLTIDSLRITEFKIPEKDDIKEPNRKQNQKHEQPKSNNAAEVNLAKAKVVDSLKVAVNIPTNDTQPSVGTPSGTTEGPVTSTVTGTGTSTTTYTSTNNDPVPIADNEPEFEGGLKALYTFVGSKLKYPTEAYESGKEGIVHVKFVVDVDGKVTNLSLLNSIGYGLDQEALRVVAMIPKFKKPGMVAGKPVRVYYHLPIKFKVNK